MEPRRLMSLPGYLSTDSTAAYDAASNTLTVTGAAVFISDPGTAAPNVIADGPAASVSFAPATDTQIHLASLTLTAGAAAAEVDATGADGGSFSVEIAGALSIDPASFFDVGRGDLIVGGGNLAQIESWVARGYNLTGGGGWNGTGITSSAAASDATRLHAVGVLANTAGLYPAFDHDPAVGTDDILVKYTFFGDANLDGKVDGSDYSLIDARTAAATGWAAGDFNYDGRIDGSDYALIDNAFNLAGEPVNPGNIFYVSPTGSDGNNGISPETPWQTVAKVNATAFEPGDTILFENGGVWDASLDASSSGATGDPITYSDYGDPSLADPVFSGSDPISTSLFTQIPNTNTYTVPVTTPVDWVFDGGQFTSEANDLTGTADDTTDINCVLTTAESFFYDPATSLLYVDLGTRLSLHTISIATRVDAVYNNSRSNLVFDHLSSFETAEDNSGYGFRAQNGINVTFENCTATSAGKHAFGAIDADGFRGLNLSSINLQPDLGYGGASGFVSFSDVNTPTINSGGDHYTWQNLTFVNTEGAYPAFVTHGDAGAVGSVDITNLVSNNGYGGGIDIETTGPDEQVLLDGGQIGGASITINTSGSIINGFVFTGPASIVLSGDHEVVQNCLFDGSESNVEAGRNGEIVDNGVDNTIRFNTFYEISGLYGGPAIGISTETVNTTIVANVFADPWQIGLVYDGTTATSIQSDFNAYTLTEAVASGFSTLTFSTGTVANLSSVGTLPAWFAQTGQDADSAVGDFTFADVSAGDFALAAGTFGSGFYAGPLNPALAAANAFILPDENGRYDAGVNDQGVNNQNVNDQGVNDQGVDR